MNTVLVADDVHPLLIEGLKDLGYEIDFRPMIQQQEVNEILENYVGVIINTKTKIRKELIDKVKHRLKFIGRLGSGMEIIDVDVAKEAGISVFSAPEGNAQAVAEHALGMLLALFNNLCNADREVREKIWRREANRGLELQGKTVGVIGLGHNGTAFAKLLKGFNVRVLGYDKYKSCFGADLEHVKSVSLEELKEKAEIISLHLPLNDETKFYIDKHFVEDMKQPFYLINTSRGRVVNTVDLVQDLLDGKVLGACLDVFENENPNTYTDEETRTYEKLFCMGNVILSPHIAGWTKESKQKIAQVLVAKITSVSKSE